MTVGHERAHASSSASEGLAVVVGGWDALGGGMGSDLAEEAQDIRLVAAFLALTGEPQRPLGKGVCSSRRPASICAS